MVANIATPARSESHYDVLRICVETAQPRRLTAPGLRQFVAFDLSRACFHILYNLARSRVTAHQEAPGGLAMPRYLVTVEIEGSQEPENDQKLSVELSAGSEDQALAAAMRALATKHPTAQLSRVWCWHIQSLDARGA